MRIIPENETLTKKITAKGKLSVTAKAVGVMDASSFQSAGEYGRYSKSIKWFMQ